MSEKQSSEGALLSPVAVERCAVGHRSACILRLSWLTLLTAICVTSAFLVAFVQRWFPLGLPGQWEWARYGPWDPPLTSWPALIPAGLCAMGLAAWTFWALGRVETTRPVLLVVSLAGVVVIGAVFQMFLELTAPTGLQKWAALYYGFRVAARDDFDDVDGVLRDHARMIADYEPDHCSANPVGWILVYRALLSFFDAHPEAATVVWQTEPEEIAWALRNKIPAGGTPLADHATITTVAAANRFMALLGPLPLAWLVGQRHGRRAAVAAAALAMVIPVATLLAPYHDTVYATWATLIWALACHASNRKSWAAAGAAGCLVGLGMIFSLSFVVVGALAALFVTIRACQGARPTGASVAAAVAGWAAVLALFASVGHLPWETWSVNLAKNHEFNVWSGCSYAAWVLVNPLELAVSMGVPVSVYLLARLAGEFGRSTQSRAVCQGNPVAKSGGEFAGPGSLSQEVQAPRRRLDALLVAWVAIVTLLDLAGSNRGEICRLWYFLMPVGAALAIEGLDFANRRARAVLAALVLWQALECAVLSRELALLWLNTPHDAFETYVAPGNKTWSRFRRLSDEEFQRRQAAP